MSGVVYMHTRTVSRVCQVWYLLIVAALLWCGGPYVHARNGYTRIDCGEVDARVIDEASGIAISRVNPDILWTHNDSGDMARVFAIGTDGSFRGEFHLDGFDARDCEDIAVGPGPERGVSYLYLADIGDNRAVHSHIRVYRFPEPQITPDHEISPAVIDDVETLTFTYPDGPRDAETLLIDPVTGDLTVVTKREQHVRVYQSDAPLSPQLSTPLVYLTDVPLTQVVGGDISPDGARIILKTYHAVFCWERASGVAVGTALQDVPEPLAYTPEPQGEAICWSADGKDYYTLSERKGNQPLHLYYYTPGE